MSYYKGDWKKVMRDGAPCRVRSYIDELGTDPEAREALKPRGVFEPYYDGGVRITLDGAPCRVALHVKGWTSRSRGKISAYLTDKERRAVQWRMDH